VNAPNETLTFADSFGNALPAGQNYQLILTHTVNASSTKPQAEAFTVPQPFSVVAPEFTIDPSIVQKTYPQTGGNAGSGYCILPHIVLDDEALPWERNIVPGGTSTDSTPWMALIVFAEKNELPNNTVSSMSVQELIGIGQSGANIGPAIGTSDVDPSVLNTQCQTIQISAATFNNVMPAFADLRLMAHTQTISSAAEGTGNASVLLANRMPQDPSSNAPMQFYAHLVSLEGFSTYLSPGSLPSNAQTVQLVTLYNWSFVAVPQPSLNFETLLTSLNVDALTLPALSNAPQEAANRLSDGYAPLQFVTTSGDETFAWYRGPFSPVQAQTLPPVGNPSVPASSATSADALAIYSSAYGLFDLSYAAAWNFGRARAMADAHFAQGMLGTQQAILQAAATLAQRMAMPHLAGIDDPRALLAADVTRRRFGAMGGQLRGALSRQRTADGGQQVRRRVHPRELLARADVREAIAENVGSSLPPVMNWLTSLVNLVPVPFSHLVPYPAMLPVESIRFFVVDRGWIDALIAGATSIALQGAGSLAANALIREQFLATAVYPAAGVLVRSQLVSTWPTMLISGTGDANFAVVRDATLSTGVRLVLFNEVPSSVTLSEPYHGIQLGMDVDGSTLQVTPRYTSGANIGMPDSGAAAVAPQFRPPASGAVGGVFDVSDLAAALGNAGPGDFGVQMVRAPYQLTFNNQQ